MRVCQLVSNHPFRWHFQLAELLRAKGHDVHLYRSNENAATWPRAADLLIHFESLVYRRPGAEMLEKVPAADLPCVSEDHETGAFDILIQFADDAGQEIRTIRTITPQFDGQRSEAGALAALLDRRELRIGLMEQVGSRSRRAEFAAALDDVLNVASSLANVCSRVADMITSRVDGELDDHAFHDVAVDREQPNTVSLSRVLSHATSALSKKVGGRLMALAKKGDRWAVAWRALGSSAPLAMASEPLANYRLIPNQGHSFLADPFVFSAGDENHLFVEDFDYASGKGAISVLSRDQSGGFSDKRVVLEQPYHLSYPMVFADGGQIWMVPESGDVRRVELYRAVEYPFRWVREAVLIDELRAFDSTLHRDERGYWLLCTTAIWSSSTSDFLVLYHSPSLLGPWALCGPRTAILDSRVARPAGKLFSHGEHLMRPVQDCLKLYGSAIQLCEITGLDQQRLSQVVKSRIEPTDRRHFWGAHTYNFGSGLEVVDVFGFPGSRSEATLRRTDLSRPGLLG